MIPLSEWATEAGDDESGEYLDERVSANHLLRRIDLFAATALVDMRQTLADHYSHTGRPSIDPELLIRMLIVVYCYGIRSKRGLCEEVADWADVPLVLPAGPR